MCFFSNVVWKTFVKDYLTFSKKERLATLVVILILFTLYFLPRQFAKNTPSLSLREDSLLQRAVDTLQSRSAQNSADDDEPLPFPYSSTPEPTSGFTEGELFSFNPNTLPAEGWQRLGLNSKTIRILVNYRNKGGKFYRPEDLQKVWTMPVGFYERVKGHISIPPVERRVSYPTFTPATYTRTERKIEPVEINTGDTAAFIALPGIGPVLASRIIRFRDRLGGFYSVEQVRETYGLPDSTFQLLKPYFTLEEKGIRRINLNTATKDELNAHPYIDWKLANAIIEYRNQHGSYQSVDDLKNLLLLDEVTFLKIRNYVAVE